MEKGAGRGKASEINVGEELTSAKVLNIPSYFFTEPNQLKVDFTRFLSLTTKALCTYKYGDMFYIKFSCARP
jgi:hypothetical protein